MTEEVEVNEVSEETPETEKVLDDMEIEATIDTVSMGPTRESIALQAIDLKFDDKIKHWLKFYEDMGSLQDERHVRLNGRLIPTGRVEAAEYGNIKYLGGLCPAEHIFMDEIITPMDPETGEPRVGTLRYTRTGQCCQCNTIRKAAERAAKEAK